MIKLFTILFSIGFGTFAFAGQVSPIPNQPKTPIFLIYESPYSYEETKTNIFEGIKAKNFRAYAPRLLEQDLGLPQQSVDTNKKVFRFCNFEMLNDFLKIEPRLGVFLPCNITVTKTKNNKTFITVPNLTRILPMFENQKLNEKAKDVKTLLEDLIEEALL